MKKFICFKDVLCIWMGHILLSKSHMALIPKPIISAILDFIVTEAVKANLKIWSSEHQFFDTADPKFDKYYSILILSDSVYKNNHLKYKRVFFSILSGKNFAILIFKGSLYCACILSSGHLQLILI